MHLASLIFLMAASIATASPAAHPLEKRAICLGGKTADNVKCCVWFDVLNDLQTNLFDNGKCENGVHKALRLQFHDSIGLSNSLTTSGVFGGGGADGSIIEHADVELAFGANSNLGGIVASERAVALTHNVSFADMIQFAAAAGITNCPGAPRLEFLAGRPFVSRASPPNLVPGPRNSVDQILNRMADAGLSPDETVDLMASHSIAAQQGLNPSIAGSPLDSTPDRFDTQFFIETLLKGVLNPGSITGFAEVLSPLPGEFRMQSDFALARDPRTSCRWQELAGNPSLMRTAFRAAMVKLSLLGNDRRSLVDCSSVIPTPPSDNTGSRLPAGKVRGDVQGSCAATPFPSLPIAPGPIPTIDPVVV